MDFTGRRLGTYDVIGRLGAGGMGEVWLARDPRLEREVALKTLPQAVAGDPEQLARFRREALALAALNHPNIATIHGLETLEDGTQLLVMERVDGETLAARLGAGALPLDEAVRVCARIAEALEVAHERGVIHRDLKPGNVMVGARGRVKVLDFGLARATDVVARDITLHLPRRPEGARPASSPVTPTDHTLPNAVPAKRAAAASGDSPLTGGALGSIGPLTQEGAISGTPGYMSPEQASGERQDQRTDVFAFGCVLFECLSGVRAFRGEDAWETITATLQQDVDERALPAATPPAVRDLVARCLAKQPSQRLASMRVARETLEQAAGGPAPAPAEVAPHNLPRALSSFVGRAAELATAEAHLAQTRLLTLTGVGGCGKTRLALELAFRRLDRHPGGVWFADLARVSDAERVPEVVAAALGVREEQGRSLVDGIAAHLAPRRALLVLDNCEHVLGVCSELAAALLGAAPELTMLATSREGLGVPGEMLQAVPSLTLPARGAATVAALEACESVRLFVERATAARQDFVLDDGNAAAVGEVCRRLDGIPLALELAAARARVLSMEQIRERLDDRFRLLTGGSRTALPRHQTLRAALQWSWDQLLEPERELLRMLAVFAGGWTFGAVIALRPEGEDEFEVLDLLTRLVDKSLVVVERGEGSQMRYRFLESVRQFALEQLDESGAGAMWRGRHLEYFLALAERSERHLNGPQQAEWLRRLEVEQENLLAALAWCADVPGGGAIALRLAGSVWRFWSARGHYELGRRAMEEALARPGAEAPTPERARALVRAGGLALYQGDWDAAAPLIAQSLELYRTLGDDKGVARALAGLAIVATYREDDEAAERTNLESLELYRRLGEKRGTAVALHNLGYLAWSRGEHETARGHFDEAIALLEQVGDRETLALTLAGSAEAQLRLGDLTGARDRYTEALRIAREREARREACYALEGVADLAVFAGSAEFSARLLAYAAALRREIGSPHVPREQRERDRVLRQIRAELGEERFTAVQAAGTRAAFAEIVDEAIGWLATARLAAPPGTT